MNLSAILYWWGRLGFCEWVFDIAPNVLHVW